MRTIASILAVFGLTLALAGCGGSSGCGSLSGGGTAAGTGSCNNSTPPPAGSTVASLSVSSSVATLPGDGSSSATITVLAKDANNNAVGSAPVTLSASAGALTGAATSTDKNGNVTATLSAAGLSAGASITVTATSGSVSGKTTLTVAAVQRTVTVQTSSPQIPSDNTSPATITAVVKDANNNFVPNVVVQFQASSGGLVVNPPAAGGTPGLTDSRGTATATLSVGGDQSLRTITVTATLGTSTSTVNVNVVGTTAGLAGPSSLVLGNTGTYTISLNDAGKNALPNQNVQVTSSAGNTLSASTVKTDASGHATFTVTASKAGADTLSASALGTSASLNLTVSSQQFQFTAPAASASIAISASPCTPNIPVSINWQDNGMPVAAGTTVSFSSTRGTLSASSAVTDASGNAQVMICATSAGPATLSASGSGVSATRAITFISTNPSAVDLQASPSTVPITGQSTLTAIVRDAAGNLVANQAVDFTLSDVTGGSLSLASATTDVQGIAQTVYTASNTASATNGVSVNAKLHSNTAINKTATLTVDGAPLHISFGTGNKLLENGTQTAFIMNWFVSVLDSTGHPVPNTQVTLTIHSSSSPFAGYMKGAYTVCGGSWVQYDGTHKGDCAASPQVLPTPPTACANEDVNLNGQLDTGEDLNVDGALEPGDIALASPGVVTTGSDGTSTFQVIYPEDHANWVQVTLTANATVSGTESSNSTTFVLPILASYLTNVGSSPPGAVSPYGTGLCGDKH